MNISRFKAKFCELLHYDEPSDKLALSFAIGVFVAFTPTIGLHFLTILAVAWLMRLNKLMAIMGTATNNPWTLVPICGASMWVGLHVWPVAAEVPRLDWSSMSFSNISLLKSYVMPFIVGSIIMGTVCALVSYLVCLRLINYYRLQRISKDPQGP